MLNKPLKFLKIKKQQIVREIKLAFLIVEEASSSSWSFQLYLIRQFMEDTQKWSNEMSRAVGCFT